MDKDGYTFSRLFKRYDYDDTGFISTEDFR